jgi:hypothetical protein
MRKEVQGDRSHRLLFARGKVAQPQLAGSGDLGRIGGELARVEPNGLEKFHRSYLHAGFVLLEMADFPPGKQAAKLAH